MNASLTTRRRRAIAIIWVVLLLLVLVGFVGLALDTGHALPGPL